jgi:hypothetical protein
MNLNKILPLIHMFEVHFTLPDKTYDCTAHIEWRSPLVPCNENEWSISDVSDEAGNNVRLTTDQQAFLIQQCEEKL